MLEWDSIAPRTVQAAIRPPLLDNSVGRDAPRSTHAVDLRQEAGSDVWFCDESPWLHGFHIGSMGRAIIKGSG